MLPLTVYFNKDTNQVLARAPSCISFQGLRTNLHWFSKLQSGGTIVPTQVRLLRGPMNG